MISRFSAIWFCLIVISASCNQSGAIQQLEGSYAVIYDIGGGTYRTTLEFHDSLYVKEFFFLDEDELISRCEGEYRLSGGSLVRKNRTCRFLRSEEPSETQSHSDIITGIKQITDSSFILYLDEDDHAVPETALWLKFIKENK